jgi:hypothetical protein
LAFFKGQTSVSVSFIYCRKVSSLFSTEAWTRFRLNRQRIETIRTQLNQLSLLKFLAFPKPHSCKMRGFDFCNSLCNVYL